MPRILYIASSWPIPSGFGGQLRAFHVGRALKHVGDVSLCIVSSEAKDGDARLKSSEEFRVVDAVRPQTLPTSGPVEKLRWALDSGYLNLHGVAVPEADQVRIHNLIEEYDLIWVLNSRTPNILQRWHWPHSHLDLDDVPSTYLRSVADHQRQLSARWKSGVQRALFKRRELLFKKRFTTLSVCSEEDKAYLGGGARMHVIPNGFERPHGEPLRNPATAPPRLGFIGLYDYGPNQEGVRWFLETCWPLIRKQVPGIRFRLAGKGSDGLDRAMAPDVDVLGYIDDAATEIATWSGMIIPIRFGGGTRVKIADAFSRKCPVVSTRLGAFGYDVEDGKQLYLADTPDAFSAACVEVVTDPNRGASLAEQAWKDFLEKWTWEAISPRIWRAAEDCLSRSR